MHTATIEGHFECQFKSLNDLACAMAENDDVLVEHYKVEAASDFEITAASCLQAFDSLVNRYLKSRMLHLVNNPEADPFPIVEKLVSILDQARVACQACVHLSDVAQTWGHPLECAGGLINALGIIDSRISEIRDNWPVNDCERMEISRRNHERGNAKDAKDVFEALQTQDA